MNEYNPNSLEEYIKESKLIVINNNFKIRLSKKLLEKYNKNLYHDKITLITEIIAEIKNLNIIYPANAKPVFYLYIVPDDNFATLLNYPKNRSNIGGGRPVASFDLESFNNAYGSSSNMLERPTTSIMSKINYIHEFSHLVHSMFFNKDRFICEGFAEVIPYYILDYEDKFLEHKELLSSLKSNQILTAKELIELGEKNNFDSKPLIPNKSISFELPYISSYLFVRGCIEIIEKNFNLNKQEALQKFLGILRSSQSYNAYLVYEIANSIGIDKEELLNGKNIQINIIKNM